MKIGFDIGGVISKYPEEMKELMRALQRGGLEVHVVTDMPIETAHRLCAENGIDFIPSEHIHSAAWSEHQDRCKAVLCTEWDIDILIDDRPDYCAEAPFIGLVVAPRPQLSYHSPLWNDSSKTPAE